MSVDEIARQLVGLELWQLYMGYTMLLLMCGLGAPINSDLIMLTTAGLLASEESVPLTALAFFGWLGIVTGDSLAFGIARRIRRQGARYPKISRWMEKKISGRVEGFILAHGGKGLVIARFLPGTRTATILAASFLGLPFRQFLIYNAGTLLFYVSALHLIGRYAGQSLRQSFEAGEFPFPVVFAGLIMGCVLLALFLWARHKRPTEGQT